MNDDHNPKKLLYKFNIQHDEFTGPVAYFDAETPFPTVNLDDDILRNGKSFRVTKVWHDIVEGKDFIEWITVVVAVPSEQ